jgi:hypothetical protein
MTNPATPPQQLSDEELVEDYQETGGEAGDDRADADAAEIERRGLDL